MNDTTSLGRFIRESRLQCGMSLGQLAATVGRSSSSVRRWERDEVAPALTIMPVLAEALEIDVRELEVRRPAVTDSDDTGQHIAGGESGSTIEQPVVVLDEQSQPPEQAPHRSQVGFVGDLWNSMFDSKDSWIGWIRGALTAVFVIIMILVLVWAIGELFDALRDVWGSFGTGG